MNINCIICSDLFVPTSAIYGTRCGHIFHYTCLIQWIERSKTCPQCRNSTSEKTIFRVFFNIVTSEGIEDDAVTLQSKLDAINLQLRLKDNHVKTVEEQIKTVSEAKIILEDKYKQTKQELEKTKTGIGSLKDQLVYYKDKAKYVEKAEQEVQDLRESLKRNEDVLKAITGSIDEANEIINSSACPKTLSVIATSLKKELKVTEKKKNNYFTKMKRAENELHSCKKDLESLQFEREKLKHDLIAHKQCEQEMQALKNKISDMMDATTSVDPTLVRVATESPAPSVATKNKLKGTSTDSPSVADRVKEIKQSNSPYLKIRSSSMGLLMKSQDEGPRFGPSNISIFKKALSQSSIEDLTPKPLPDYNYDGFGGHSKDEKFPVPRPPTGIKRTKSMSSSKFKKLAKPNKKLDEYLEMLD